MSEVVFIPARDAYQISLEHFEEQLRKNRLELKTLIDRATQCGEFKVIYDRQLHENTITWLRDYGYEVSQKYLNDNEKSIWVISWENAE